MKKIMFAAVALGIFAVSSSAFAHVVVRPDKTGIGAYQTFTVSVPSERDTATMSVRLVLADGLASVTPTVKPGWNVEVKKHEFPDGPHPYEIIWSNGNIPGHFRDEFTFSAKVPATPTTLIWKAYQTYSDGTVVSWELSATDQPKKEDGSPDFSAFGPYSQTLVADDLSSSAPAPKTSESTGFALGITAILISLASLVVSLKRK